MYQKDKVRKALTLVVPSDLTRDMNRSDLDRLMGSYAVMEDAQEALLNGQITPDEYCHLCEMHNINVDSYMETIECNLIQFNLM